jgi:coproporphyrinogen III oxidase-like Fe-S oxidoreductase
MGLPKGLTEIEQKISNGLKMKSIDFRRMCHETIRQIFRDHSYHMVHDCIWAKSDDMNYKIINQWNQTCTMPHGIWVGIGISAIGNIENFGPVKNEEDIGRYIEIIQSGSNSISCGIALCNEELMRCEIISGIIHRNIDAFAFKQKYGNLPQEVFSDEFRVLVESELIDISNDDIVLRSNALPYLQAMARFFHSRDVENEYRKSEICRLDYRYYKISYESCE